MCVIIQGDFTKRGHGMQNYHTREELEQMSAKEQAVEERYTPRPKSQIILAWVLTAVVVFAFLGTCYWLAFGKF